MTDLIFDTSKLSQSASEAISSIETSASEAESSLRKQTGEAEATAEAQKAEIREAAKKAQLRKAMHIGSDTTKPSEYKAAIKEIESKQELNIQALAQGKKEIQAAKTEAIADVEKQKQDIINQANAQIESELAKLVRLDTGEYVEPSTYNSLTTEQQAYLMANGVDAFNEYEQKTAAEAEAAAIEAARVEATAGLVELNNGEFVTEDVFNSLTSEQQELLKVKGVDKFNEYLQKMAVADVLKDSVKLDNGEYVDKDIYTSLTAEERAYLQANGIDAFNNWQNKLTEEFLKDNIKLNNGDYVPADNFNSLTSEQQAYLMANGVEAFNNWQQELLKEFENNNTKLNYINPETNTNEWVSNEFYNSLTTSQQLYLKNNGVDAFYNKYYVKLDNGEYIETSAYNLLTSEQQQYLKENGIDKYNEWVGTITIPEDSILLDYQDSKGNKEYVKKEWYQSLTVAQQSELNTIGSAAFLKKYYIQSYGVPDDYMLKSDYDALPSELQYEYSFRGLAGVTAYLEKNYILLGTGEYYSKSVYDSLPSAEQSILMTGGTAGYQSYINDNYKKITLSDGTVEYYPINTTTSEAGITVVGYNDLSSEAQRILNSSGIAGLREYTESQSEAFNNTYIAVGNGEFMYRESFTDSDGNSVLGYNDLSAEDKAYVLTNGITAYNTKIHNDYNTWYSGLSVVAREYVDKYGANKWSSDYQAIMSATAPTDVNSLAYAEYIANSSDKLISMGIIPTGAVFNGIDDDGNLSYIEGGQRLIDLNKVNFNNVTPEVFRNILYTLHYTDKYTPTQTELLSMITPFGGTGSVLSREEQVRLNKWLGTLSDSQQKAIKGALGDYGNAQFVNFIKSVAYGLFPHLEALEADVTLADVNAKMSAYDWAWEAFNVITLFVSAPLKAISGAVAAGKVATALKVTATTVEGLATGALVGTTIYEWNDLSAIEKVLSLSIATAVVGAMAGRVIVKGATNVIKAVDSVTLQSALRSAVSNINKVAKSVEKADVTAITKAATRLENSAIRVSSLNPILGRQLTDYAAYIIENAKGIASGTVKVTEQGVEALRAVDAQIANVSKLSAGGKLTYTSITGAASKISEGSTELTRFAEGIKADATAIASDASVLKALKTEINSINKALTSGSATTIKKAATKLINGAKEYSATNKTLSNSLVSRGEYILKNASVIAKGELRVTAISGKSLAVSGVKQTVKQLGKDIKVSTKVTKSGELITKTKYVSKSTLGDVIKAAKVAGEDYKKISELLKSKVASSLKMTEASKLEVTLKAQLQKLIQKSIKSDRAFINKLSNAAKLTDKQLILIERLSGIKGIKSAISDIYKLSEELSTAVRKLNTLNIGTEEYIKLLTTINKLKGKLGNALETYNSLTEVRYTFGNLAEELSNIYKLKKQEWQEWLAAQAKGGAEARTARASGARFQALYEKRGSVSGYKMKLPSDGDGIIKNIETQYYRDKYLEEYGGTAITAGGKGWELPKTEATTPSNVALKESELTQVKLTEPLELQPVYSKATKPIEASTQPMQFKMKLEPEAVSSKVSAETSIKSVTPKTAKPIATPKPLNIESVLPVAAGITKIEQKQIENKIVSGIRAIVKVITAEAVKLGLNTSTQVKAINSVTGIYNQAVSVGINQAVSGGTKQAIATEVKTTINTAIKDIADTKVEELVQGQAKVLTDESIAVAIATQSAVSPTTAASTSVKTGTLTKTSEAVKIAEAIKTGIKPAEETKVKTATKTAVKVDTGIATKTNVTGKSKTRVPFKADKSDADKLTKAQKKASIGWKQGFIYKLLLAPNYREIINTRNPIEGVKYHTGLKSAYKSIAKVTKGKIPAIIKLDMGIMDITIVSKGNKPRLKYKQDLRQRTTYPKVKSYRGELSSMS